MRSYSSHDLLGKKLGIRDYTNTDLFTRLLNWIEGRTESAIMTIHIPALIYLKTEDICESINARYKEYSVDYYAEELVSLLYNHFIDKAFNNKNGLKHAYDVLTKYERKTPVIIFHNAVKVYEASPQPQNKSMEIDMQLSKKEIRRGELLLYELDDLYGHHFTVESLIESIWIEFINDRRYTSHKKIINELIEILESK